MQSFLNVPVPDVYEHNSVEWSPVFSFQEYPKYYEPLHLSLKQSITSPINLTGQCGAFYSTEGYDADFQMEIVDSH